MNVAGTGSEFTKTVPPPDGNDCVVGVTTASKVYPGTVGVAALLLEGEGVEGLSDEPEPELPDPPEPPPPPPPPPAATVIVSAADALVTDPESVTVTVNVDVPDALGVPEICPTVHPVVGVLSAVHKARPAGRDPLAMAHDEYVPVPAVAASV